MRSRFEWHAPGSVAALVLLVAVSMVMPALAMGQGSGEPGLVTGTITTAEPLAPSPDAVAVVTIVDRSAGGDDVIVGQQRRADPGSTPISFKVAYDPGRIQGDHAYVVYAAIVDGGAAWQNGDGVPVITGGPTSAVPVGVTRVPGSPGAEVLGQISTDDKTSLTGRAVALAALQDTATGRLVAWTAITPTSQVPIDFRLGFDPATVDPGAPLGAWAAIVDGSSVWQSRGTQPLVAIDDQLSAGVITVAGATSVPLPPKPTPTPEPTPPPTPAPTPEPTPGPSATPTPPPTPEPTPVTVPDVAGQAEAQAVTTLEGSDLVVDETKRKYNESAPKGTATKTDPAAGTQVPPQTAVDLFISKGPEPTPSPTPAATPTPGPTPKPTPKPSPVVVPDVKGIPEADAIVELNEADLKAGERTRRSNASIESGSVIKTDPAADSSVQPDTKVDLVVSTGPSPSPSPKPVAVPAVRGLPEPDAIIAITDADLRVGERTRKSNEDIPAGSAIKTDPEKGTKVPPDSLVDLFVSTGPTSTASPSPTAPASASPAPSPATEPSPSASYPTTGTGLLSGVLVYREPLPATDQRQVFVSLLEVGAFGTRVVPVTQYVASGSSPQAFVIGFDWAEIDPAARYRVVAAIVDGAYSWISREGTPAITQGAPVSGLTVPLWYRSDILEGEVSGIIIGTPADLSPNAFHEVYLVRGDTGAVVGYDARRVTAGEPLAFSIPFLLEDIDESVAYLVVARVTDGPSTWTGPGVPVITQGAPYRVAVPVVLTSDTSIVLGDPVPEVSASPQASAAPQS